MKKTILLVGLAISLLGFFTGRVLAFHDGGVAHCNGCHTMHNSENGAPVDPAHPNGNAYLLKFSTASDVCISCHGASTSRGVFGTNPMAPQNLHGGGDFAFLLEDNLNDAYGGGSNPILGTLGGHSIISATRGTIVDPVHPTAPGGTYPASQLGCTSCHDPHAFSTFRGLNDVGHVVAGNYNFSHPAPNAVGITLSSGSVETNTNHTAYRDGMSAWCANCHGNYHNNGAALVHPSGMTLGGTIATTYGLYNGTANPTGGNPATAYLAVVAFEDMANTTSSTAGPSAGSLVSCITCHRAHASSAPNSGRWDFNWTEYVEEGVNSGSYAIPNPYAPDNTQRSLCNKCHQQD